METEQDKFESFQAEKREVETEYDDLSEISVGDIQELESRIERLHRQKQELKLELNELQSVIGFNQGRLEVGGDEFIKVLRDDSEDLTDELLPEETITCWTSSSEVAAIQFEATIHHLRNLSQQTVGEINDLELDFEKACLFESNKHIRSIRGTELTDRAGKTFG